MENIKASTIKKLSEALETTPAFLMMGTDQGKYSFVNSAAIADLIVDKDAQELLVEINALNEDDKKELLSYAQYLKKKREG